jgi:hypothetical protein
MPIHRSVDRDDDGEVHAVAEVLDVVGDLPALPTRLRALPVGRCARKCCWSTLRARPVVNTADRPASMGTRVDREAHPCGIRAVPVRRHDQEASSSRNERAMITCHVRYEIDADKIDDFERFARRWIRLVTSSGGIHHGYFLPSEGSSDEALALFSFPSFAAYETYRQRFATDSEFIEANQIRDETRCVVRYERTFFRPLLEGD